MNRNNHIGVLLSRIILVILLYVFNPAALRAGGHLLFQSLIANPLEARIGTMYQFGDNKLRLDIGHSFDLMVIDSTHDHQWNAGGDFSTYTRLRSEGRLKFPVETVDYYFGVNTSVRWKREHADYGLRVRVAHISAHLADGLANDSAVLHPKPFVYSREFIEAIGSVSTSDIRLYAGCTGVFSNHHTTQSTAVLIPQAGCEWSSFLTPKLKTFAAYDLKLASLDGSLSLVHALQAGVSIPQHGSYDLIISLYYYHGLSLHGLFYYVVDDYPGIGFQVGL